jgi:hypothetical protein
LIVEDFSLTPTEEPLKNASRFRTSHRGPD